MCYRNRIFFDEVITLLKSVTCVRWCSGLFDVGHMRRVGQYRVYTVHIRYSWQGNHHMYGHIRCTYTVLASPTHARRCTLCAMNNLPVQLPVLPVQGGAAACLMWDTCAKRHSVRKK